VKKASGCPQEGNNKECRGDCRLTCEYAIKDPDPLDLLGARQLFSSVDCVSCNGAEDRSNPPRSWGTLQVATDRNSILNRALTNQDNA
jgi:hypothetical protein